MLESESISGSDIITAANQPLHKRLHLCALVLAGVAIVSSAFHFWPFEDSKVWQMLCPSNMAVILWILILIYYFSIKRWQWTDTSIFPQLSVFAYLAINILSISFAADIGKAISYTGKLTLMLIAGYILFSSAICGLKSLRIVYISMTIAVITSITYCLSTRFGFGSSNFGFFDNPNLYGTYVGILVPLCASYLILSSQCLKQFLAALLIIGALVSFGSLGGIATIVISMMAFAVIVPRWPLRIFILVCLAFGIGLIILLNSNPALVPLRDDIQLVEQDGINLKQRYIEWQAELNLLEERTVTGTAAGCINDYRSNFYYRLPKLNTLKAYDQNGWLATVAETGILGLVCFCWIVACYLKSAYSQVTTNDRIVSPTIYRLTVANLIGLIAVCVANLISSVHYNGILIVFVLVLTLISRTSFLENELKC